MWGTQTEISCDDVDSRDIAVFFFFPKRIEKATVLTESAVFSRTSASEGLCGCWGQRCNASGGKIRNFPTSSKFHTSRKAHIFRVNNLASIGKTGRTRPAQ